MSSNGKRATYRIRSWSAGILLLSGVVLSPLALTGIWAKTILTDNDAYVEAVAPLASDPVVTDALEDELVAAVMNAVENIGAGEAVEEYLSDLNLPESVNTVIVAGLTAVTQALRDPVANVIRELVSSQGFVNVWEEVNRVAHQELINVMADESALVDTDGNLALQLEPLLELVRGQLVASGHEWATNTPPSDLSFVVVEADDVASIRTYYTLVSSWAIAAGIISVCALAGAVLLAHRRRRSVMLTFATLAGVMVIFRLLLGFGVSALGERVQNPDAVQAIAGTVASDLTSWIRSTAVISLLVALTALAWGRRTAIRRRLGRIRERVSDPRILRATRIVCGLVAIAGTAWLLFVDHTAIVPVVVVVLVALGAAVIAVVPDRHLIPQRGPVEPEQVS